VIDVERCCRVGFGWGECGFRLVGSGLVVDRFWFGVDRGLYRRVARLR
jgi:hypothetical protein